MMRSSEHIIVPLARSQHISIGSVTALGTDFAQGITEVDTIDLVVLTAGKSYTAVHMVGQPTGFLTGAWRLCRHGDSQ